MARVNAGEAAVISLAVKTIDHLNNIGALVNPSNPPVITITDPNDEIVVNAQNMTFDSTGLYYYNYPTTAIYGRYRIDFSVLNGTLYTLHHDYFTVGR